MINLKEKSKQLQQKSKQSFQYKGMLKNSVNLVNILNCFGWNMSGVDNHELLIDFGSLFHRL